MMTSLIFFISIFFGLKSPNNDHLKIFYGNEIRYYDQEFKLIKVKLIKNNKDELENYNHLFIKNDIYFLGKKSGDVHEIINDSLIRIDNTIDHRMTVRASVFLHNDTIFKYGGYGYWSQRNFMTYYNKSSKEWEVYRQNNTYLPIGSYNGLNFKQKQKVYFFGGSKVDIKNRLNTIQSNEVVMFDFESRNFSLLGELNVDFENYFLIFNSESFLLLAGKGKLIKINPKKNLVDTFELPPILFNTDKIFSNQSWRIDNQYYFIIRDPFNEVKPIQISAEEIFSNPITSHKLYKKEITKELYVIIGLCLTIIFLLVYLLISKKRKRTLLTAKGIYYKAAFHKLENKQIIILSLLKEKGRLSTSEILLVTENKALTYVHNIRSKNEFIDKLNNSISFIFGLNKLPFHQIKGEKDKRIKYLIVSEEFTNILRKIYVKNT